MTSSFFHFRVLFAALITLLSQVKTYPYFQFSIPNGDRVPHPCPSQFLWKGVGHYRSDGGGPRNAFGQDFYDNGLVSSQMFVCFPSKIQYVVIN